MVKGDKERNSSEGARGVDGSKGEGSRGDGGEKED